MQIFNYLLHLFTGCWSRGRPSILLHSIWKRFKAIRNRFENWSNNGDPSIRSWRFESLSTGTYLARNKFNNDVKISLKVIKAEDIGKLSSVATVNIKITDINDKNPEFVGDPYKFQVKEGINKTSIGFVRATDADEGINAMISYIIPSGLPFDIDNQTGEITTNRPLDYETQKVSTYDDKTIILFCSCIAVSGFLYDQVRRSSFFVLMEFTSVG